jgi:hypothetical protein
MQQHVGRGPFPSEGSCLRKLLASKNHIRSSPNIENTPVTNYMKQKCNFTQRQQKNVLNTTHRAGWLSAVPLYLYSRRARFEFRP